MFEFFLYISIYYFLILTCTIGVAANVTGNVRFPADIVIVCTFCPPGITGMEAIDGGAEDVVPVGGAPLILMTCITSGLEFSTATIEGWESGLPLELVVEFAIATIGGANECCTSCIEAMRGGYDQLGGPSTALLPLTPYLQQHNNHILLILFIYLFFF